MRNNNRAVVRRLTNKSLKANKKRNFFIIMAISLTTLLLCSVFSIGSSLLESIGIEQIRITGTMAHATLGYPTASQMNILKNLDYVLDAGAGNNVAYVKSTPQMEKLSLTLYYSDETEWKVMRSPAYTNITGNYPVKENEIMVSLDTLKKLGIGNPSIGMEISLDFYTEGNGNDSPVSGKFVLSGWFKNYGYIQSINMTDTIYVSEAMSQKYGKTVETDGAASVLFINSSQVTEYIEKLKTDLGLSKNQPVTIARIYDRGTESSGGSLIALSAIAGFLVLTGYLLIYNVLYISISRDVRFYGLLKTLGTTPRQIRSIVAGQILRLCVVGIPSGVIISLLFSFAAVPGIIAKFNALDSEPVISFSPSIYLGAVFFALLTALLGAFKPAKKAAEVSPVEAQKFTGINYKRDHVYRSVKGKPYKMALRNIFRDKKRAVIVILSLFLGVTAFLAVTTLVGSMGIDYYIKSVIENDFTLKCNSLAVTGEVEQKFNAAFLDKLKDLPGFEGEEITTREWMRLEYSQEMFGKYLAQHQEQIEIKNMTDEAIGRNFLGMIAGIDAKALMRLNKTLDKPIDIDAFERGEFALIASDNPAVFDAVHELAVIPLHKNESGFQVLSGKDLKLPLGGFVPAAFKSIGYSLAPTVLVSNSIMKKLYNDPIIYEVALDISDKYEQNALNTLKQITDGDPQIMRSSRLEVSEELTEAKTILYVLGGGISLIIALIGMLNFVNVMSVGIMVRRNELATLESVGMSRSQVMKLLVGEGLGYALITLLLAFTIGGAATFGIFSLFRRQATYIVFTFPYIPSAILVAAIIAICITTPAAIYRSICKSTIVERLREAE